MTDQQPNTSLQDFFDGDLETQPGGVEDSASDVGTRIAEARVAAGRTQEEIANQLGVKVTSIENWERGDSSPRSNRLTALAGILGVSMSWLLIGHGVEPTTADGLADIKVALERVHARLTDTLNEVDVLMARLDTVRTAD